jgi:hypothetical protein
MHYYIISSFAGPSHVHPECADSKWRSILGVQSWREGQGGWKRSLKAMQNSGVGCYDWNQLGYTDQLVKNSKLSSLSSGDTDRGL